MRTRPFVVILSESRNCGSSRRTSDHFRACSAQKQSEMLRQAQYDNERAGVPSSLDREQSRDAENVEDQHDKRIHAHPSDLASRPEDQTVDVNGYATWASENHLNSEQYKIGYAAWEKDHKIPDVNKIKATGGVLDNG